jgi:hypothetical protein
MSRAVSMDVVKGLVAFYGLIAFTPEMDCDHTAISLPSVTSAVFLVA